MECSVKTTVTGQRAVDGAGVRLVRVLGHGTVDEFDPFLMLDSFDSTDPDDYMRGFPFHPHRGIETITYLAGGQMNHRDSLGNSGAIRVGQAQWMCAGSGIMHEEMPQASERMLGVQLWLNLPAAEKMAKPAYHSIEEMPEVMVGLSTVRIVGGSFAGVEGFQGEHLPADFLDVSLVPNERVEIPVKAGHAPYAFLLEGDAEVAGRVYREKTALAFASDGDAVTFAAGDMPARVLYFSAPRLDEPVAWGGPIVMNTERELEQAFAELEAGTFIKEQPEE